MLCAFRFLEDYFQKYGDLLESFGEKRVTIRKLDSVEDVLKEADASPIMTMRLCASQSEAFVLCWTAFNGEG